MKLTSVSRGVYRSEDGRFWVRPWINHRRTWRKLRAVRLREAVREAAMEPWRNESARFATLAQLYVDAQCPNRRLEGRPAEYVAGEAKRVESLRTWFGPMPVQEITLALIPRFARWRMARVRRGKGGGRTVDRDLATLSNVMNYAVRLEMLLVNPVMRGRPRYTQASEVRHAREVAPASAMIIHQLAAHCFQSPRSEVFGWMTLFAMFTGCRTSELLRLRTDAAIPDDPGFCSDGYLFLGRRSKDGVNPWAMIGPEFAQMMECWARWHAARWADSPWYFPGYFGKPVEHGSHGRALAAACRALDLPHITPHGLRSYYVTKRRSDGVADLVIAGEIGDTTVSLMQTTYGARPPNWTGGAPLSWLPAGALPAWLIWQDEERKVVRL